MTRMTRAKLAGLGLATLACSAVLTVGVAAANGGDGAEQPTLRITLTDEDLDARVRPAQQPSPSQGDRDCPNGERAGGGEAPAQPNPAEEDV
jgi:hypothetical protein